MTGQPVLFKVYEFEKNCKRFRVIEFVFDEIPCC